MSRFVILSCALLLSGCNSFLPSATAPEASMPATPSGSAPEVIEAPGVVVPPPLADLDCAPRAGAITCN